LAVCGHHLWLRAVAMTRTARGRFNAVALAVLLFGECTYGFVVPVRLRGPVVCRTLSQPCHLAMIFSEATELEQKKKATQKRLEEAEGAAEDASALQTAAEKVVEVKRAKVQAALDKVAAAQKEADEAAAEMATAEEVVRDKETATEAAREQVKVAQWEVSEATEALAAWELANPVEAAGKLGAELGGEVASAFATGLLSSIFGESKSERLAREAQEEEARAAERAEKERAAQEAKAQARAAEERKAAAEAAAAKAAEEAAAAAEMIAAAEAAAAEEERKEAERIDAELREKREQAKATLKSKRSKKLTDLAVEGAFAAASAVAGSGDDEALSGVASWAEKQREKARLQAEAKARTERILLFEADLELLGLSIADAPTLDEKTLRKAFRERSRDLHPDMRGQQDADTLKGVPSVYELNAAYEALREVL
jgi:hypothetical protein